MTVGLSRRELFGLLIPRSESRPVRPDVPEAWLPPYCRPPGAVAPGRFAELCDGCGDCIEACPEGAILRLGEAYGELEGTPAVLPASEPCHLCDGLPCAAACPTGALAPVAREQVKIGVARWSPASCWVAMGQPCDYCVTACPLPAPALEIAGAAVRIDERACTGCGLCAYFCTANPKAIEVESV